MQPAFAFAGLTDDYTVPFRGYFKIPLKIRLKSSYLIPSSRLFLLSP